MTILDSIVTRKIEEVRAAKAATPLAELERRAQSAEPVRGFAQALVRHARTGVAVIAEIKRASPSKGVIRTDFDPSKLAKSLEHGGAACLSVLTDGPGFQGSLGDLEAARRATRLPVLRKDFMIDPYQIVESRAHGADCILLIMACLDDAKAQELFAAARACALDVLVETHDAHEVERALRLGTSLIGVNNRDLRSFDTNLSRTERLAPLIAPPKILVSESGIHTRADVDRLRAVGAQAFLIGESLMRAPDPEEALRALIG